MQLLLEMVLGLIVKELEQSQLELELVYLIKHLIQLLLVLLQE